MTTTNLLLILLIVSTITGLTRALPYILFGRKGEVPEFIDYLSIVLPASIMVILVIYNIRHIDLFNSPFGLPEILSMALVFILHKWKKNTFISMTFGTGLYMILIRTVFKV